MNSFVDKINSIVTVITDYLLAPVVGKDPLWGLLAYSVFCGVLLLLCYGKVSSQKRIKAVKKQIGAALLESVLYRKDVKTCLGAQFRMLIYGIKYFLIAVPPILVLMLPCILMLAQMNLRYDTRGLNGEALLRVSLSDVDDLDRVTLKEAEGLSATPRLRIAEGREALWRISADKPLNLEVALDGGESVSLPLVLNDKTQDKIVAKKVKSPLEALLYPGAKTLAEDSAIDTITVQYPGVSYHFLGIEWHWLVLFLVVSIVAGLVASKVFGVAV